MIKKNNTITAFGCIFALLYSEASFAIEQKNIGNLTIYATLVKNGSPIKSNIHWHIFDNNRSNIVEKTDKINIQKFNELTSSNLAKPSFTLPPGDYYVQCSFGRVSAIKTIHIAEQKRVSTSINLNVGAVQMQAQVVNGKVNTKKLQFSVYSDESENDKTSLIDKINKPAIVIPLKAGSYHLVSKYGNVNSIKRANIRVTPGDISQITLKHEAAQISLRLLRNLNSQALADTKWSIKDASGDTIFKTNGVYAKLILTHGEYIAIAENKKHIYQKDFIVESGKDNSIDVLTSDKSHFKTNKSDALVTD